MSCLSITALSFFVKEGGIMSIFIYRGGQVLGGRDRDVLRENRTDFFFAGDETKRVDYDCHIYKDVT